jgi:hypothetical protein
MDFEKFAEAGCRALGFADWEFVRTYNANRAGQMQVAAEAHPVSRAVVKYMSIQGRGRTLEKPLYGNMQWWFDELVIWREQLGISLRDWPKNPTRLASDLRRVRKPLAAVGIVLEVDVDLRYLVRGGSQKGVSIAWANPEPVPQGTEKFLE